MANYASRTRPFFFAPVYTSFPFFFVLLQVVSSIQVPLLSLSDAREDDLSLSWSGGMYTPVRLNKMDVSGSEIGRNTIGVCVCVCVCVCVYVRCQSIQRPKSSRLISQSEREKKRLEQTAAKIDIRQKLLRAQATRAAVRHANSQISRELPFFF